MYIFYSLLESHRKSRWFPPAQHLLCTTQNLSAPHGPAHTKHNHSFTFQLNKYNYNHLNKDYTYERVEVHRNKCVESDSPDSLREYSLASDLCKGQDRADYQDRKNLLFCVLQKKKPEPLQFGHNRYCYRPTQKVILIRKGVCFQWKSISLTCKQC